MQESAICVDKAVVFLINFSNFVASNNNLNSCENEYIS